MSTPDHRGRRIEVQVNVGLCRSCKICVEFCPEEVLVARPPLFVAEVARIEACTGCRMCEFLCPDWAIFVDVRGPAGRKPSRIVTVGGC